MPTQTASRSYRRFKLFKHSLFKAPFLPLGGADKVARHWIGRFQVNRFTLEFPGLPPQLDGLTITHLSDLHCGHTFTLEEHLPPVIAACELLDSDLICMTGDWVDEDAPMIHPLIEKLRVLQPRQGWCGVIGNHDIVDSREEVVDALHGWLGSRLLLNSVFDVDVDGARLRLAGLDYAPDKKGEQTDAALLRQAWPEEPAEFVLGLSHHPRGFDSLRKFGARLSLSGHTHGGQCSLTHSPLPAVTPFAGKFLYLRGLYEVENAFLYVSVGTGQGFPLRLGNPPEIAHFTLRRGP